MERYVQILSILFLVFLCLVQCVPTSHTDELIYGIISPHCWNELLVRKTFNVQCLKLVFSKLLGYGIVFASSIVKVPQVINIVRAGNTEGLSEFMLYMESFGYILSIMYPLHYNQPFSTYGESVFIAIQAIIIMCLLWYYNRSRYPLPLVLLIVLVFVTYTFILYDGSLLTERTWTLLYGVIPQASKS
eukprot:TRINITY_DN15241_c0_g2_i2.p1 TRINITY_DN15241_c0_g2~~TRINITY_DN15241_c0_g2_i2.p1  ORF type:complete len:188 (+),score=34.68 TRINITY_DN15241_c0_g2_i2:190-753(+)